jgi:signal transduction histidine kinase/CheY-like chemotaxis protein/HPt (histidine-containing phosphotransfer) domain-containing protein
MPLRSIFKFEFKVAALMLFTFVVVVVIGLVAYFRFSDLLGNISQSVRGDSRLVLSHSLKNDLTELTNLAKTHSLTEDDTYRNNYSTIREDILRKLSDLKKIDNEERVDIDLKVLDSLVYDKLIVLDGIMYSEDPFRVQTALGKVVVSLDVSDKQLNPNSSKVINQDNDLNTQKDRLLSPKIKDDVELDLIKESKEKLEDLDKEEDKLLKKIKRAEKRNNIERVAELDSLLNQRKSEAVNIHKKLIRAEEYERDKTLTINQIYKGIEDVSTEELLIEKEIKQAQLELISMDNYLSRKIANVFDEFELIENAKIAAATKYAEEENEKTNTYVAIFGVFFAALLCLIAYIIIQYVKKNNLYKLALKRSNNETERLIKTRERLMATISHEIRTPMHAISGFAEQLSKEDLTERQQEYLSMIRKSSEHLTYLVNDVLDFSKLQNRKLKLEKTVFDLRELANDVLLFSKELVADQRLKIGMSIDNSISEFYIGDTFRLRQILLNLMSNAIKFTDSGSVSLSFERLRGTDKADTIKIKVEDTGIGVDEGDIEKVFTEFEQAGKGTKNTISGTGLGLSITKMLVELHEGTINMISEKGKGTTVEIILDLEISEKPMNNVKLYSFVKPALSSVLIVDDELYNRKLLKAMFQAYSICLFEAENGQEALKILNENSIELILLDARMPVMDGKEAIRAIRNLKDARKRDVKIILLTAAENETQEILDQAQGFVSKPFSQEKLINEINRVCGGDSNAEPTEKIKFKETSRLLVDFNHLKTLSGNDQAFYVDMLNTFISTTSESHKNIKVGFSNDDWELMANEAHKIASPCKHIGAGKLHSLLKNIEQSARNEQKTKQLKNLIKELDEEVSFVLKAVNKELTAND